MNTENGVGSMLTTSSGSSALLEKNINELPEADNITRNRKYKKHIEFAKNEADTHPQTGQSISRTIVDVYFYDDYVLIMGWGTFDKWNYIEHFGVGGEEGMKEAEKYILYTKISLNAFEITFEE